MSRTRGMSTDDREDRYTENGPMLTPAQQKRLRKKERRLNSAWSGRPKRKATHAPRCTVCARVIKKGATKCAECKILTSDPFRKQPLIDQLAGKRIPADALVPSSLEAGALRPDLVVADDGTERH